MKRKFLIRTFLLSLAAMLLFGVCSVLILYFHAEKLVKEDLMRLSDVIKDEAERENASFQNLTTYSNTTGKAFRTTFIDLSGTVLADSISVETGENHLDRPEIKAAIAGSPAFHKRYSQTLGKKLIYYAVTFESKSDGGTYILRVALEASTVSNAVFSSLPVFLVIILALAGVLVFVSSKYNASLVVPFQDIKNRLHTLNTGNFEKIPIADVDNDILPLVNEINDVAENMLLLNQVRSEFFANASHELNTPLTYISGYAELMEAGMLTDGQKIMECGGNIRKQAARMDALIKDMLKLSALEVKDKPPELEDIDISKFVDGIIDTFSVEISEKNITVSLNCFLDTVKSDKTLLYNILVNLIQNAIRYNKQGGAINVVVKKQARHIVEISVADNGIGIDTEDKSRIFERFYRADKSRSRVSGGTGLGLAIVKHSVQKLSGTVTVESVFGEGSKFIVSLPER